MRNAFFIWKREVLAYLQTPTAYAAMAVFLVIGGYFFSVFLINTQQADMRPFFGNMGLIMLFISPVLTMRLLAEETSQGTDEILFTQPITYTQAVLGKYLAAVTVFLIMLLISGVYPIILEYYGNPEWGVVMTGYLGFLLLGSTFLAVGLFTSSLTDSQMVAGIIGFAVLLLLWVVSWAADTIGGTVGSILRVMAVTEYYQDFRRGIIDTRNVLFYLSFIVGFLFLTGRMVEKRTWGS